METLKSNSRGPLVEYLQSNLKKLGFYKGAIDGIFGKQTQSSVIQFQHEFYLTPDGIVGSNTWNALMPYINGLLWSIVPTDISYSYDIMQLNIKSLLSKYSFLNSMNIGKSILNKDLPCIRIGIGAKQIFYNASIHANEWITSVLLMKFIEDFAKAYSLNTLIEGYNTRDIFNNTSMYIAPMVNPDGVDLVTGAIKPNSLYYNSTQKISNSYPRNSFSFSDGKLILEVWI